MQNARIFSIWLATACFLNSFLMFLVQPMVAKAILPAFGGSAAVWTGVMLFFQSALVIGYGIAHVMRSLRGWRLVAFYSVFLVLALVGCQLNSLVDIEPGAHPTISVLSALAVSVGIPFLLNSVTTPLIQVIYFRAEGREPYWLYGVSNVASVMSLLLYPIVFEPTMELATHMSLWRVSLGVMGVLVVAVSALPYVRVSRKDLDSEEAIPSKKEEQESEGWKLAWFVYPFLASVALLSFTTHITIDVAPVPLLWVLPLGLYLLTFVLVFAPRPIVFPKWVPLLCLLACFVQSLPYFGWGKGAVIWVLPVTLGTMFLICWFCHGRLVLIRPHASGLTRFYFALSVGGAAGGIFSALIAPSIFADYFEFPILLIVVGVIALWCVVIRSDGLLPQNRSPLLLRMGAVMAFAFCLALNVLWFVAGDSEVVLRQRNFYGSLRVQQDEKTVQMVSGRISHGVQVRPPGDPMTATAYFHTGTVLPVVFDAVPEGNGRHIAVMGLGAGTVAVYNQPSDVMTFFEINPLVGDMAKEHFTFMEKAKGKIELGIGDGRKLLEAVSPSSLDILMIDAFTGDSVPVHLLTEEAYVEYTEKLKPLGYLVYNISNRHLQLSKLMVGLAESNGWALRLVKCRPKPPFGNEAHYAVFTRNEAQMPNFESPQRIVEGPGGFPDAVLWTDQYSNLFGVLKIHLK
ncbi:MAG: fused MFS/spermidine synthase [Verrucomicrobiota bacterium]